MSPTQINLSWTDNSTTEDGFRIERAPGGTTIFVEIGTVASGVTSYQNIGLAGSTSYSYRIRAYNSAGNSDYSAVATATTQLAPPTAPSGLAASSASSSQVNLSWTDNSNNEDGFKIERSTTGNTNFIEVASVPAGATSYQNTGLAASTSYTYRVRAFNAAGMSSYSNSAAGFTAAAAVTPPAAPSALTANAIASNEIDLAWADNSSDEEGFRIERAPGGTASFVEIIVVNAGVVSYHDHSVVSGTPYSYRVRSYNAAGTSAYSSVANDTTPAAVSTPAAPSALAATSVGTTAITVSWTINSINEDGFRIERAPGGTTSFVEIGTIGAGINFYINAGLTAATSYSYRVRAYNGAGNSAYTNTVDVTTSPLPTPPNPPSNLVATPVAINEIDLTWTDNSNNEDAFFIERAPGTSTKWAQIAKVGPNVTSYHNIDLPPSTGYSYRVQSSGKVGVSAYSNTAYAVTLGTPPAAPTSLVATAVSTSEIDLTWTDNSANETGFRIERAPGGTTNFVEIATVGANVASYHDVSLPSGTPYSYQVRSYNGGGNSAYTNTASATTQSPASVPAAPSNLVATASTTVSSVVHLTWNDNSSNELYFVVEESANGGAFVALTPNVPANSVAADVSGRLGNTTLTYRIRAYNAAGYSTYSNVSTTTTLPSQIVLLPSADNLLQMASVNGNVTSDGNTVFQTGEDGAGCNTINGSNSAFFCVSTAFQFSGFASAVAGRTITGAVLRLSPASLAGDFGTTHAINAFAGSWSPTSITWNNQPLIYTAQENDHPPPTALVQVDYDVTGIVQLWANGTWVNNGLLLRDLSGPSYNSVRVTYFWSVDYYSNPAFRPQLIINVQ
jgi:hypothetical protein